MVVNRAACFPSFSKILFLKVYTYHWQFKPERERSINHALEAVIILSPMDESITYKQIYLQKARDVLQQGWGLSVEDIERMLAELI